MLRICQKQNKVHNKVAGISSVQKAFWVVQEPFRSRSSHQVGPRGSAMSSPLQLFVGDSVWRIFIMGGSPKDNLMGNHSTGVEPEAWTCYPALHQLVV